MRILFSIIIPAYNEKKVVLNLLESLKKQRFDKNKFEIIIVNNNSTDKTRDSVLQFKKYNTNLQISLVEEARPGVCMTRNTGGRSGKGKVLIFLDADNIVPVNFLNDVYRKVFIENYAAGTIKILPIEKSLRGYIVFSILEFIKCAIKRPFGKSFVKKEIFSAVNGFDEKRQYLGTNLDFLIRVKKYIKKRRMRMTHISNPIYTSLRRFEEDGYVNILSKWGLAYLGFKKVHY